MRAFCLVLALAISACTSSTDAPEPPVPSEARLGSAPAQAIAEPTDTVRVDSSSTAELASPKGVPATGPPDPQLPPARSADRRYAVLVGLNDYPGQNEDLPSGQLDVAAMRDVLIGRFRYRPENILVLTDRQASRGQIRRAFRDHLAQAGADGSALFYFSGHGLQTEGNQGLDVETDGQDEAIYVWADRGERGSTILDDELGAWADGLATDHVLTILDACHSGTGFRGPEGWIRGHAPKGVRYADVAPMLDSPARAAGRRQPTNAPSPSPRYTLLAAAQDSEVALSGLPGHPSLFTAALTGALREADLGIGLSDLMDGVRQTVQYQSNQFRSRHTPQLDGRDQPLSDVFGTR